MVNHGSVIMNPPTYIVNLRTTKEGVPPLPVDKHLMIPKGLQVQSEKIRTKKTKKNKKEAKHERQTKMANWNCHTKIEIFANKNWNF